MKKFLSLVLALVMTMSLVTVSAGAKDFTDDSSITYQEAVDVMSAVGVIDGYTDGSFQPTTNLTRGAAAKIICNLILGPTTASALGADTAPYSDVPTTNVFAGYIAYCQKEGIISGYADGTFRPSAPLTGYAFMKMLLGALGYDSTKEGYTGANWSVNVAKQAIAIGLDDGNDDFVGQQSVNREEAMLYAFNTMQATMVEYGNDTTITVGDVVVSQSGKASEVANGATTETIKNDNKMQFAEKYFTDLKLSANGADAFNRPANVWKLKSDEIGTYAKTADATYTEKVEVGDIYKDLGLGKTIDKGDVSIYEDGEPVTSVAISKASDTELGGNGVLTQVYYDSDDETVTITLVNTYVGTINRTVAASGNNDRYIEVNPDSQPGNGINKKFETEEEFEDDAYVLYTYSVSEKAIQSVKAAESVDGTITKVVDKKSIDLGDTTYKFSAKYVAESLNVDSDYTVYVDEYGYAIYVEEQEFVSSDYALFVEAQDKTNFSSNRALLIFTDGTYKVVDTAKNYKNTIAQNSIVTYKVNDDNEYTLKAVNTTKNNTAKTDTFTMANGTSRITVGSETVYSNSNTVFVVETDEDEYSAYTGTNNAPGITATSSYGHDVTAYYYCKNGSSIVTVMFIFPGDYITVESNSSNVLFIAGESASKKISTSDSDYYEYNAVVNGEVTTVKVADDVTGVIDASSIKNTVFGSYAVDSNGVITKLNAFNNTTDKYTSVEKGTAKVSGEYTVTLGNKSYTVADDAKLFYVNEDGEITSTSVNGIAKDGNDEAYYVVKDGQITYLFIQEKADDEESSDIITIPSDVNVVLPADGGAVKVEYYDAADDDAKKPAAVDAVEYIKAELAAQGYTVDKSVYSGGTYTFDVTYKGTSMPGYFTFTPASDMVACYAIMVNGESKMLDKNTKIQDLKLDGKYVMVTDTDKAVTAKASDATDTIKEGYKYVDGYYKVTAEVSTSGMTDTASLTSSAKFVNLTAVGGAYYVQSGNTVEIQVSLKGSSDEVTLSKGATAKVTANNNAVISGSFADAKQVLAQGAKISNSTETVLTVTATVSNKSDNAISGDVTVTVTLADVVA